MAKTKTRRPKAKTSPKRIKLLDRKKLSIQGPRLSSALWMAILKSPNKKLKLIDKAAAMRRFDASVAAYKKRYKKEGGIAGPTVKKLKASSKTSRQRAATKRAAARKIRASLKKKK